MFQDPEHGRITLVQPAHFAGGKEDTMSVRGYCHGDSGSIKNIVVFDLDDLPQDHPLWMPREYYNPGRTAVWYGEFTYPEGMPHPCHYWPTAGESLIDDLDWEAT